jgi:mono/diheme cytochrome c family protein
MKKISWLVLFILSGFFISCSKSSSSSGNLYVPTSADVTVNATLEELQQGRTLYIGNCGNCHALVSPDAHTVSEWKSIIADMAPKTNMNASEVSLVTKYVCRGKQ